MEYMTAKKIVEVAEELLDSPASFIDFVLQGCDEHFPKKVPALRDEFSKLFDHLYAE